MDELDRRILELLREDARRPIAEIAREADVARATVHQRLDGLQERGIVAGTSLDLDPEALGYPLRAFIFVEWRAERERDQRIVARQLAEVPGVDRVHIVTGSQDFLVEALASGMDELGETIIEELRAVDAVGDTETRLTFWTVEGPGVPLEEAEEREPSAGGA